MRIILFLLLACTSGDEKSVDTSLGPEDVDSGSDSETDEETNTDTNDETDLKDEYAKTYLIDKYGFLHYYSHLGSNPGLINTNIEAIDVSINKYYDLWIVNKNGEVLELKQFKPKETVFL